MAEQKINELSLRLKNVELINDPKLDIYFKILMVLSEEKTPESFNHFISTIDQECKKYLDNNPNIVSLLHKHNFDDKSKLHYLIDKNDIDELQQIINELFPITEKLKFQCTESITVICNNIICSIHGNYNHYYGDIGDEFLQIYYKIEIKANNLLKNRTSCYLHIKHTNIFCNLYMCHGRVICNFDFDP